MISLKNIASMFVITIAIVVILIFGKDLLIPFVLAWLLWFIVRQIRKTIDRIGIIERYLPIWLKNILALTVIIYVFHFFITIIISNVSVLAQSHRVYQENAGILISTINSTFNVDVFESIEVYIANFNFGTFFMKLLNVSTDFVSSTFMILLYALFIFLEEASLRLKFDKLFPESVQSEKAYAMIKNVEKSLAKYLGIKTILSVITGVSSYIALSIIGIDSPLFWAFLIFILNYIPVIGSLTATLFPAVFSLLQFGDFMPGIIILLIVGGIQILVGNIIEPRLMGNSMNVSPIVTIAGLSFWGAIWGIIGMIISVPIMVVIVIVLSQFKETKAFAILLSSNGKIET